MLCQRLALVDLGSNALRLEIIECRGGLEHSLYRHRAAIRIGSEAFTLGEISPAKIDAITEQCVQFQAHCQLHGVDKVYAIATSAAREAHNSRALIDRVADRSGIEIRIISGREECELLILAVTRVMDLSQGTNLCVDLGGGSIEAAIITRGKTTSCESHPVGVLRFDYDHNLRGAALLAAVTEQCEQRGASILDQCKGNSFDRYIAIGGHMDALLKILSGDSQAFELANVATVQTTDLSKLAIEMSPQEPAELAVRYALKADRADSIVAAATAYGWIASHIGAERIWAPGVSLRQGMVAALLATNAPET